MRKVILSVKPLAEASRLFDTFKAAAFGRKPSERKTQLGRVSMGFSLQRPPKTVHSSEIQGHGTLAVTPSQTVMDCNRPFSTLCYHLKYTPTDKVPTEAHPNAQICTRMFTVKITTPLGCYLGFPLRGNTDPMRPPSSPFATPRCSALNGWDVWGVFRMLPIVTRKRKNPKNAPNDRALRPHLCLMWLSSSYFGCREYFNLTIGWVS